jgi:hypothetical protein
MVFFHDRARVLNWKFEDTKRGIEAINRKTIKWSKEKGQKMTQQLLLCCIVKEKCMYIQ